MAGKPIQEPWKIQDWRRTEKDHVWYSPSINKYLFSDEAEQFDGTAYDTLEEAAGALDEYVKNHL